MALSSPTVTVLDEPSPEPSEGMSAIVEISTRFVMPVRRRHSRTSSCSNWSTWSTISVRV